MEKWKKNDLVETMQTVGLDPLQFELDDNDDSKVRITHKCSPSWFTFSYDGGLITGSYVVGDGPEWGSVPSSTWHGGLLPRITAWLREVKLDIETPDKWAELQKEAQFLSAASDSITENSPFTSFEQNQIADQLQVMVERAQRTYSLSSAQTKALNDKLDYVVEASHRLGRKDWFLLFAGVIFTYLATLLPPEAIRDMSLGFLKAISHLHGFADLPLLP